MGNPVVDNAYYEWLLKKIECFDTKYYDTLDILFSVDFLWEIPNDDNRAEDGIVLRSTFMNEEGWNTSPCEDRECSILEMMIALSMRIDNDIMWDGETDRSSRWFWEMFRNLKLDQTSDRSDVFKILDVFLNREYDRDGNGGLFPLENGSESDLTEMEIWYQAQLYLMDNYGF